MPYPHNVPTVYVVELVKVWMIAISFPFLKAIQHVNSKMQELLAFFIVDSHIRLI